jgi:catechol 2,3-dioxygenase-like lactoylglutathione lyase family enzyme
MNLPWPSRSGSITFRLPVMITGLHGIIFSPDADAVRALLGDALGFPSVDAGGGWRIYATPPAELAAHPSEATAHELYLMCDDLEATMAELRSKGVEIARPVSEERWGVVTAIALPGGGELGLYEPRHPRP